MSGLSGSPTATDEAETLAAIMLVAEATLAAWPEACAAVLFGSRARGDHLPPSDWDIAFITRNGDGIGAIPDGMPINALAGDIQTLAVPEDVARRKALSIEHVGHGVVRVGKLLAGGWNRPEVKGTPAMEPERHRDFVHGALNNIEAAVDRIRKAGDSGAQEAARSIAANFMDRSADAAEHLAMAMFGRRGIDANRRHSVNHLAEQAERIGHPGLAESIRKMDGLPQQDQTAIFGTTGDVHHAIRRLSVVIEQLERELASAAKDPQFAAAASSAACFAATSAEHSASVLRPRLGQDAGDGVPFQPDILLAPLLETSRTLQSALRQLAKTLQPLSKPEPG